MKKIESYLNKKDAAEFLGVSVRTFERLQGKGKVKVAKQVPGRTGPENVYARVDLLKLRSDQAVDAATTGPLVPELVTEDGSHATSHDTRLVRRDDVTALAPLDMADLNQRLVEALEALKTGVSREAPSGKLLLTLPEVTELTGLSRGFLVGAIRVGKLKARIMGKAWRVKRDDLDAYVKKI
jgi:excisionase family DNA binding protein